MASMMSSRSWSRAVEPPNARFTAGSGARSAAKSRASRHSRKMDEPTNTTPRRSGGFSLSSRTNRRISPSYHSPVASNAIGGSRAGMAACVHVAVPGVSVDADGSWNPKREPRSARDRDRSVDFGLGERPRRARGVAQARRRGRHEPSP